jgi:phenylpropionate dioxygenase-like ring-hydroxylating dioxygenase large terminal subunit
VLRGASTYLYDGNWKLQTENGADGYHVTSLHWNYAVTTSRRKQAEKPDEIRAMDAGSWAKQCGGFYSFENGHLLLWTNWANPEDRPNWERREELAAQFGQACADWMVQRSRNLCLCPNVYLMDQFRAFARRYRPPAGLCLKKAPGTTNSPRHRVSAFRDDVGWRGKRAMVEVFAFYMAKSRRKLPFVCCISNVPPRSCWGNI